MLGQLALRLRRYQMHRRILADGMRSVQSTFEGGRLHYYEGGLPAGEPLVLLHGFLDTAQTFRRLFRSLGKRFRLIAIDVPGFGYSTLPEIREIWDLRRMARILARFIRFELDLKRSRILTHSMGGLISLHAAEYMQRVYNEELFCEFHLAAPGLLRLHEHDRNERRRLLYPQTREEIRQTLDALYHHEIPELPDLILDGLLREWSIAGYFFLAENTIEEEDLVFFTLPRLRKLGTRLHLYWGNDDHMTPIALAERIRRGVPGTTLVRFDHAGHALHIEEPGRLAEAFLNQIDAAETSARKRRTPPNKKGRAVRN